MIFSRRVRVWLFLVSVSLFWLVAGYSMAGRRGLLAGLLLMLCVNYILFFFGDDKLLEKFKAKPVLGRDPWNLNKTIQNLAKKAGISPPKIFLIPNQSPTALASSQSEKESFVAISQGLLDKLSPAELEAILAIEVAQIKSLDAFMFGVLSRLSNSILSLAEALDKMIPLARLRFLSKLSTPIAWLLIRIVVHKKRYFNSDEMASRLVVDKNIIAQALWKIEHAGYALPLDIPQCSEHLFIVSPPHKQAQLGWWMAHPKIEDRIRRICGFYPI